MPEIRTQNDFKVIISLSEDEARRLAGMLFSAVSFDEEPVARDLYEALASVLGDSPMYEYVFDEDTEYFVPKGEAQW